MSYTHYQSLEKSKTLGRVIRDASLLTLPPDASVREATALMSKHHCGAVGVVDENQNLIGILADRDIIRNVVCSGKNPDETDVGSVMTGDPETIDFSCDANDALEVISRLGYRYLPVLKDGKMAGILDVRDLYEEVRRLMRQALEHKDMLLNYVFHEAYGASRASDSFQ